MISQVTINGTKFENKDNKLVITNDTGKSVFNDIKNFKKVKGTYTDLTPISVSFRGVLIFAPLTFILFFIVPFASNVFANLLLGCSTILLFASSGLFFFDIFCSMIGSNASENLVRKIFGTETVQIIINDEEFYFEYQEGDSKKYKHLDTIINSLN